MKAIPAKYNNVTYRSRLEARWAVFFDHLNIPALYEHEGFQLESGEWYLPDFYLPSTPAKGYSSTYLEVKPTYEEVEKNEATFRSFADESEIPLVVVVGPPPGNRAEIEGNFIYMPKGWDNYIRFFFCTQCEETTLDFDDSSYADCLKCKRSRYDGDKDIKLAAILARDTSFWNTPRKR